MQRTQVAIIAVAILTLAACHGRRESMPVTGAYGHGMLSGEVSMAEGSPAGVEVSVRGTGMALVLAEDGRFAFGGVPAGAHIDFRRAADGVEASLRVEESGHVVVELSKTAATAKKTKGSKHRSLGNEFEGIIRRTDAGRIVVFTSKKVEQEIALDDATVVRKGNQTLTAADLEPEMRVHVKARKEGEAYTAVVIIVQQEKGDDGGGSPAVREYEGTVRSASATELVVFTSHKEEVAFAITAETVIRKGNTSIDAADIQEGWRVHVKATASAGGTATATRVTVQSTKTR